MIRTSPLFTDYFWRSMNKRIKLHHKSDNQSFNDNLKQMFKLRFQNIIIAAIAYATYLWSELLLFRCWNHLWTLRRPGRARPKRLRGHYHRGAGSHHRTIASVSQRSPLQPLLRYRPQSLRVGFGLHDIPSMPNHTQWYVRSPLHHQLIL